MKQSVFDLREDMNRSSVLQFIQTKIDQIRQQMYCAKDSDIDSVILLWRFLEMLVKQSGVRL